MGSVEEEEVQARHRRELRELQGRITNKKKNATKKTRRGVLDECAALERALHEKHEAELQALHESNRGDAGGENEGEKGDQTLRGSSADGSVGGVTSRLADTKLSDDDDNTAKAKPSDSRAAAAAAAASATPPPPLPQQPKKRNRQRERLARRAAALEQDQSAAAAEAATMVDHAAVERGVLAPLIARSGRAEYEIRPDGHCLFSAVADQMAQLGRGVVTAEDGDRSGKPSSLAEPYRHVRWAAANYMEAHPDDFAPFLIGDDDGNDDDDDNDAAGGLPAYIARIRDTAEWGGQLELRALASTYDVDIRVLHDGRSELIRPAGAEENDDHGKDDKDDKKQQRPTVWLVYYRHGFGLGEHYNSLRSKAE